MNIVIIAIEHGLHLHFFYIFIDGILLIEIEELFGGLFEELFGGLRGGQFEVLVDG